MHGFSMLFCKFDVFRYLRLFSCIGQAAQQHRSIAEQLLQSLRGINQCSTPVQRARRSGDA